MIFSAVAAWFPGMGMHRGRVIGQSNMVPRTGVGFAARLKPAVFCISALLFVGTLVSLPTFEQAAAEDAKVEVGAKPGELKLPADITVVDDKTKGKKLRPACDKCKAEGDALKAALAAYYAAQSSDGYSGKHADAKDQEKAGNSGMKDILGLSQAEMSAERKKYNAAKKSKDKKDNDSVKPDQLLKNINDALDALKKCEAEKCPGEKPPPPPPPPPPETPPAVCHWAGYDALDLENADLSDPKDLKRVENWCNGITLPKCGDPKKVAAELTELHRELDGFIGAIFAAAGGGHGGALKDAAAAADKACKAAKVKVEAYEKNTLPNLKPCAEGEKAEECPPKTGGGGGHKPPEKKKPPGKKKVIEKRGSSSEISVPVQPSGGSLSIGIGGGGGGGYGGGSGGSSEDNKRRR